MDAGRKTFALRPFLFAPRRFLHFSNHSDEPVESCRARTG
jgi:hypothetical protein